MNWGGGCSLTPSPSPIGRGVFLLVGMAIAGKFELLSLGEGSFYQWGRRSLGRLELLSVGEGSFYQ